jgi:hypothetical protein
MDDSVSHISIQYSSEQESATVSTYYQQYTHQLVAELVITAMDDD